MSIMKLSQLIKTRQNNNISYTNLGLITNKGLFILILYVHMNFFGKTNKINNIRCHRFNSEHPQYNTHNLYKFKVPKILIIQSYMIPSQKNDLENYAQAICILFTSWRTIFDIKLDLSISWEMTLKNVYPTFIDLKIIIIIIRINESR